MEGESSTANEIKEEEDEGENHSLLLLLKRTMFHELKSTKFTQQELPAWRPVITPKWAMTFFMVVGIVSLPIGLVTLTASHNVVELVHRYDVECMNDSDPVAYIQNPHADHRCTVTLRVPKRMQQPVFVFYRLTRFHQNHRRYLKSRSTKQHQGDSGRRSVGSCHPISRINGNPIVPCGLIAWSLFNDKFHFDFPVERSNIAWESDARVVFSSKVYPENYPNNLPLGPFPVGGARLDPSHPLSRDENLVVWMRAAPLPHFRKLYGRIERNLHAGEVLQVRIENVYNTYSFKGSKSLVLSTTSFLGGKNPFLGRAYLTIGVLCLLMAGASTVVQLRLPRHHPRDRELTLIMAWLALAARLSSKLRSCRGNDP